jgi:hypothetical protein
MVTHCPSSKTIFLKIMDHVRYMYQQSECCSFGEFLIMCDEKHVKLNCDVARLRTL